MSGDAYWPARPARGRDHPEIGQGRSRFLCPRLFARSSNELDQIHVESRCNSREPSPGQVLFTTLDPAYRDTVEIRLVREVFMGQTALLAKRADRDSELSERRLRHGR